MFHARLTFVICCATLWPTVSLSADVGAVALHQKIDRLIAAAAVDYDKHASVLTSDAEFLRRVSLDLTGRIPAAQQAREFFNDTDGSKRVHLIDRLLKTPEHVRHLQHQLDVMLMQRRPKKYVDVSDWQEYLFTSIRANKSWDALSREILSADGADAASRPAARFLLARDLKPEETTRDLGRIFLGRDLECAQCHDHPGIDDYLQQHFFGISAFLNRSYLFTDPKSKQKSIGEKAEGTVKFTSVFTSVEAETPPQILDLPALADPVPDKEPYVAKPAKAIRGVPKYSRRILLAKAITDPANRAFRLNIANRLWAMLMGRGLVEPLDMFHSANPPSHPEVLDLIAEDLADQGYNMRRTIREIVLSDTYQRSSRLPHNENTETETYRAGLLKPLSPEQLAWSMMLASGVAGDAKSRVAAKLQKDEPDLKPGSMEFVFKVEALVNKELASHVETFVTVFASANETSRFDATADQALFVLNGELLSKWLQPGQGSLTTRLLKCEDSQQIAEQMFLSVLTRYPTASEAMALKEFLSGKGVDRQNALQQAVRSILCSAEFRFNH